jgi:hypothetical protein
MNKKYLILSMVCLTVLFIKCKPAAEDRVKMHENAKRLSDSIARVIDAAMEEVKIEHSNVKQDSVK